MSPEDEKKVRLVQVEKVDYKMDGDRRQHA